MTNIIYIATSIDGYIADKNGGIEWLDTVPNPNCSDFGFSEFIQRIDAIIMGRHTFQTVLGFEGKWAYDKPVFVLSNDWAALPKLPSDAEGNVFLLRGEPEELVSLLQAKGYYNLYIDGGKTIQRFLQADLIDEMIITTLPILLGGGVRLFAELLNPLTFKHVNTTCYLNALIKNVFIRERNI